MRLTLPPSARRPVLAVLLPIAASCAGHSGRGGSGHTDPTLITREQITASHYTSAYDVVEGLHNNWLRARGPDSFQNPGQVVVYLDNNRLGGVETLRTIASSTVGWIRFIDAANAQARWGIGHTQGVIYVATQVGP